MIPSQPEFIIEGLLPNQVGALVGTGGVGKSTLLLSLCIHLALGREFLGGRVLRPGKTVYLSFEDDFDIVNWRVANMVREMGLSMAQRQQVDASIQFVDLEATGRKLLAVDKQGLASTGLVDDIIHHHANEKPSLLIIDPLQDAAGGLDSAYNDAMSSVIGVCRQLRKALNCAILLNHHVPKQALRDGIVDHLAGRGGSALGDGARFMWQLVTINSSMSNLASLYGLSPNDTRASDGMTLGFHVTKLTAARRKIAPTVLRRTDWLFEVQDDLGHGMSAEDIAAEKAKQRQQKHREAVEAVFGVISACEADRLTRRALSRQGAAYGLALSRQAIEDAVDDLLRSGRVREVDLPPLDHVGGKTSYLAATETSPF